jgi:hypothetical protein
MSYLRFVWFTLKNNITGEVYPQRMAENAYDSDITDAIHKICDYAVENDSVVIGGPFKTRKEAAQ